MDVSDFWELSDKEKLFLDACCWLCDNKVSLQNTCANFCLAKSTLRDFIHKHLSGMSFELYKCVIKQLSENSQRSKFGYNSAMSRK